MAIEWLKEILGEGYTEEIDTKIGDAIAGEYTGKAELEKLSGEKTALEQQLAGKAQAAVPPKDVKTESADKTDWKQKYEAAQKDADDTRFNSAFDMAVLQSKGRNSGAIKGALGTKLEELRGSESLPDALKAALEELAKDNDYLFEAQAVKEPYSPGAGSVDLKPDSAPLSMSEAIKERIYGKKG